MSDVFLVSECTDLGYHYQDDSGQWHHKDNLCETYYCVDRLGQRVPCYSALASREDQ